MASPARGTGSSFGVNSCLIAAVSLFVLLLILLLVLAFFRYREPGGGARMPLSSTVSGSISPTPTPPGSFHV